MAVKKAASSRSRARRNGPMPDLVYANASPRSVGGLSMFDAGPVTTGDAVAFTSEAPLIRSAASRLRSAGFSILAVSPQTINIAAPAEVYERAFGTSLRTEERPVLKPGQQEDTATFIDTADTDLPGFIATRGTDFADVLEGVAIEEPVYFMQSPFAPTRSYWHLRVPGDVSAGVDADRAHRRSYTGRGVSVVMVDSGWFNHQYFQRRGYNVNPVVLGPGAANPAADESGHGTAESANLLAVAPDISFTMVKINFTNSLGAFNAAVALNPSIISCSWGSSIQNGPLSAANQALGAAIALAVANGIVVVFSAGNGHWGFPGQHPDVISAGGVFMEQNTNLQASNYASGFASNIYAGRNVPDVSGLVGMLPRAAYIMLPLEPGDQIDTGSAGGTHPNGDETAGNDGWAAISGTSAAAPQVAGVCALMRQACARLTPAEIRNILRQTATDVTAGVNHPNFGNAAAVGFDLATGAGLVNANRAVMRARLACMVVQPVQPIQPIQPVRPIQPVMPVQPVQPIQPIQPISPVRPIAPVMPVQPIRPPISPVRPPTLATGGDAFEAQLAATVDAMLAAGYPTEDVDAWLEAQVGSQPRGVTPEEAEVLAQAIMEGEEFDL